MSSSRKYAPRPRKLRPCKMHFCKSRSNFCFIGVYPHHYIQPTLQVTYVLFVAVSNCFPPEVPQLARFMCICHVFVSKIKKAYLATLESLVKGENDVLL